MWKKTYNISDKIDVQCNLAVDAMKVEENITITSDQNIIGLISNTEISISEIQSLIENQKKLDQKLITELAKNNVVKYIFVFYMIPLHSCCKPLPIHIKESASGAATNEIVNLIESVSNEIENSNIKVRCIAFDGDKKYISLHLDFLKRWLPGYLKRESLANIGRIIISDPFHLLKRLRYRLVDHKTLAFGNWNGNNVLLSVEK